LEDLFTFLFIRARNIIRLVPIQKWLLVKIWKTISNNTGISITKLKNKSISHTHTYGQTYIRTYTHTYTYSAVEPNYLVSANTWRSLSMNMCACCGWKIRAGRILMPTVPHPPDSTPEKIRTHCTVNRGFCTENTGGHLIKYWEAGIV